MRCARTGLHFTDPNEGIWDDGEWISVAYLGRQIYEQDRANEFPKASDEILDLFENLSYSAKEYKQVTGRYLPLFGELGELYAEIKYGLKRCPPGTRGFDGKLGNDFVEVKTISPGQTANKVRIKRAGNFNVVVVVRITESSINNEFEFESRMIRRSSLSKGPGKYVTIAWESIPKEFDSTLLCSSGQP